MRGVFALGLSVFLAGTAAAGEPTAAPPNASCGCGPSTAKRVWKPWRPQRLWLTADRPIYMDEDKFRYEPRIRDIRFAPMSSTLPGGAMFGAPDTLPVIPAYRDGYIRFFSFR
jgi:hypothetical protein